MCVMLVKIDGVNIEHLLKDSLLKDYCVANSSPKTQEERSVIGFEISQGGWGELLDQIDEVMEFIHLYGFEIEFISKYPGVKEISFIFRVDMRLNGEDVCVQCDRFPPDLLRQIGKFKARIGLTKHSSKLFAEEEE